MSTYDVISADAHLEMPPDVWVERMPRDLRAEAPRVVALPTGGDGWVVGQGEPVPLGLQVTGGQKYAEFSTSGRSFEEGLPGTGGPEQRLQEQDEDGTDGELLFSAVAAAALRKIENPDVLRAIASAYNDWLSEYCAYAPERLFGVALVPPTTTADAVAEATRVAGLPGIRGVQLLSFPTGGDWATQGDEPFWAALEELKLPVIAHHNFGGEGHGKANPPMGTADNKPLEIDGGVS